MHITAKGKHVLSMGLYSVNARENQSTANKMLFFYIL